MRLTLISLIVLSVVYQLAALPLYEVTVPGLGRAAPDFLHIALVVNASFLAFHGRPIQAVLWAALAGGLADVLSIDPPFTHVFSCAAAAWIAAWWARRGFGDGAPSRFALVVVAAAVASGTSAGWLWLVREQRAIPGPGLLLASVLYDGVLGAAVFGLLDPLRKSLERKGGPWFARA